jgi:3-methyl-2-oxobutanoate hydroxymethyltransferase
MGRWSGNKAKFVRKFAGVRAEEDRGVKAYAEAVKASTFPDVKAESYEMEEAEWGRFLDMEGEVGWETEVRAKKEELKLDDINDRSLL